MLVRAKDFRHPILVSGCQRSGTTALTRLITRSPEITALPESRDEELAAAWILSGHAPLDAGAGRYCFQTTYVNECYCEYLERVGNFKLVWLLREPTAVVRSMVYNWKRDALNELFLAVGRPYLSPWERSRVQVFGACGISPVKRACYAYLGKTLQLFDIAPILGPEKLWIGDYRDLLERPGPFMASLTRFLGLSQAIDTRLVIDHGKSNSHWILDSASGETARSVCGAVFREASHLLSPLGDCPSATVASRLGST